jgi:hypothetical protein
MPLPLPATTAELQTLDDIRDWYRGIVEAIGDQRASVQRAIGQGAVVASRFVGMTVEDVDAHCDDQQRELERLTVLNLVASAEASIMVDYFRRVRKKKREDLLSQAYQAWNRSLSAMKRRRPDFDEGGILDVLKRTKVMDNHIVGRYRECLRARHWLGHGRYWDKPVEVDLLDPDAVYDRADALLKAMPK